MKRGCLLATLFCYNQMVTLGVEHMKAIITGMNGTVAPAVANYFATMGVDMVTWNRSRINIHDDIMIEDFLKNEKPDWFLHIATGPVEWAETVAKICGALNIQFLFTSTVSVFSENGSGPYTVESIPNAEDDYGRYKRECESRIKAVNPEAYIVRLGWQIGHSVGSNHMFDFLERSMSENGFIKASDQWYPSCSFLEDTAGALYDIVTQFPSGLYLLNSNQRSTFYEIVKALDKGKNRWKVIAGNSPDRDDRMFDDRVKIISLEEKMGIE
jgi:dTDP-4-dehydrorhamnose reductase